MKTSKIEMPKEINDMTMKSVDKAQEAFEAANNMAHENVQVLDATAVAFKTGMTDLQMKAMEFTQTNVQAAFAFTRELAAMKDPAEVVKANQNYLNTTLNSAMAQAKEVNELAVNLANETAKPIQGGVAKSVEEIKKNFATK